MRLLQKDLRTHTAPARLSPEESQLLKQINASLSAIDWERYRGLLAKQDGVTRLFGRLREECKEMDPKKWPWND